MGERATKEEEKQDGGRFFWDEASGLTDVNLFSFEVDSRDGMEDIFNRMTDQCRNYLSGIDPTGAKSILTFAGTIIYASMKDGHIRYKGDELIRPDDAYELLFSIDEIDWFPYLTEIFDTIKEVISPIEDEAPGDGSDNRWYRLGSAGFFAAYTLRKIFDATRIYSRSTDPDDIKDFRESCIHYASVGFGFFQILRRDKSPTGGIVSIGDMSKIFRVINSSGAARKSAKKRWSGDPKLEAKKNAMALWKEREAGKHPNLRRVQDFAMEVMRRWPVLTNSKTIEGWSARWTKQVKAGENPTC